MFSSLQYNLDNVQQQLVKLGVSQQVRLMVVSKGRNLEEIAALRRMGVSYFGESRLQELEKHFPLFDDSLDLAFIGNLQSNKIKKIMHSCRALHSLASFKTLEKVLSLCEEEQLCKDIFLEINPLHSPQKHGFEHYEQLEEAASMIDASKILTLRGLMTIAPQRNQEQTTREAFRCCRRWSEKLQTRYAHLPKQQLSMGMSGDYLLAIEEGSNIIRLGNKIFERKE